MITPRCTIGECLIVTDAAGNHFIVDKNRPVTRIDLEDHPAIAEELARRALEDL